MKDLISVIIVNFNGFRFIKENLDSLRTQTYKNIEIIFVDNGSMDESVKYVKENYPEVIVIETHANLGFTGGNNVGIKQAKGEFIVLLNNDTTVEPEWADAIVDAFHKHPEVGITTSKLTYYTKFLPITLKTQTTRDKDFDVTLPDARSLGVRIEEIEIKDTNYKKVIFAEGFHVRELDEDKNDCYWTDEKSLAYLPVEDETQDKTLILKFLGNKMIKNQTVDILINKNKIATLDINTNSVKTYEVNIPADIIKKSAVYIINNVGTVINQYNGWTMDIGIDEVDEGQFEEEKIVDAACGCSMGIRREVIDKLGGLDNWFFMYFEDAEYSWRAAHNGWKTLYVPKSVVHHVHTGSTKKSAVRHVPSEALSREVNTLFTSLLERNRLYTIIKQGSFKSAVKEVIKYSLSSIKYFIKNYFKEDEVKKSYALMKIKIALKVKLLFVILRLRRNKKTL